MATFTFFHEFGRHLGEGVHNFSTHQLKVALVASANAPVVSTNSILGNLTQITGGTGYTTGGVALTGETWEEVPTDTGDWRLVTGDLTLTASGGNMGPFRYVVLFNDDPTSPADPLIGYLDYGQDITITTGNTFLIDVGTSGWFQIPIT